MQNRSHVPDGVLVSSSLVVPEALICLGWLIGTPALTAATLAAHTKIVFCTNGPMQEAVAIGLEKAAEHDFFAKQLEAYVERRDILTSYFDKLGLSYTRPEGSYFLLVDMSLVKVPEGFDFPSTCKGRGKDFELCWWLAQEIKVVAIPPSEVRVPVIWRKAFKQRVISFTV